MLPPPWSWNSMEGAMVQSCQQNMQALHRGAEDLEKWFRGKGQNTEKLTKLHFYYHDLRGKTSVIVAQQQNSSPKSPKFFGMTSIMDDPLTAGPEFKSKLVGRVQGLFSSSAINEPSHLLCVMNFVFTDDKYNGSTLTVVGYNPTLQKHRELPVVGGTGVFRLARGVAQLKFFYYDVPGGNATVEYNVIVQHY
ncbi:hypothetical protein ACET3Z_004739 [Daucus carota]